MSTEGNKRLVCRYVDELFTKENRAALDDLVAPDIIGHLSGVGDFTLADMRRDFSREHRDMPLDETIIEQQIAGGDLVVTRWVFRWKHDHRYSGNVPLGRG